jgi:hypothetical protein
MSKENLDLVKSALTAATALPKPDFATVNRLFHPDHLLVTLYRHIEAEEVRGGRGYQAFLREQGPLGLSESTGDAPMSWETDFEGAVDVGRDKVLAVASGSSRPPIHRPRRLNREGGH